MRHILYKTTCLPNGKCYVGIHSTDNIDDGYIGSGKAFQMAVKKYGRSSFVREILAEFDTREELLRAEAEHVNEAFVSMTDNYNLTIGGRGGNYGGVRKAFDELDESGKITEKWGDVFYRIVKKAPLIERDVPEYWKNQMIYKVLCILEEYILDDISLLFNSKRTHKAGEKHLKDMMRYYGDKIAIERVDWSESGVVFINS